MGAHRGKPYLTESTKVLMAPIALTKMSIGVIMAKSLKNKVLYPLLKVIASQLPTKRESTFKTKPFLYREFKVRMFKGKDKDLMPQANQRQKVMLSGRQNLITTTQKI